MRTKAALILICFIIVFPSTVLPQHYAVSLKPSTLGLSLEGIRSFGPDFDARLGISYLSLNYTGVEDEDDYTVDGDIRLSSFSALVDWYPGRNAFHVTCGLVMNFNDVEALLTPTRSHEVSGRIYTPEKLGNLTVKVGFNRVAPYVGIGFNYMFSTTGFGYSFDIGALYHGPPRVDLTATGLLEPSAEQEPIIEDNIRWFSFYPVISLGLLYAF